MSPHIAIVRHSPSFLGAVLILLVLAVVAFGQTRKPEPQPAKPAKLRSEYSLKVTTNDIVGVTLTAESAPLPKIAAELSRKLKVAVLVGPGAQQHRVTADFKDLTLEPALHFLAPQVFVDYEINAAPGVQSRPVGIYLNGFDDPEPAVGSIVPAKTEAILIEGHTEDVPKPAEEVPTKIFYDQNSLTVSAKQQPLSVVLYKIAHELHIPFELKWETTELVDVNIDKLPLEEAMARLSPHVRLFVRANLQKFGRKPLRMVLVRPPDANPS